MEIRNWKLEIFSVLSIGIVGLPNVGKSTLFKALTKKQVAISNYPFCTIEPNRGVVAVPDERLRQIADMIKPPKVTSAIIEFVDIAGLVKNAHQGQGLGNQFLAHIREVDAILEVVRLFADVNVSHVEGQINSERDIETIKMELIMRDCQTLKKIIEEVKAKAKSGDAKAQKLSELLEKLANWLNQGNLAKEINEPQNYQDIFNQLQLLTAKPIIYVFNGSADVPSKDKISGPWLQLDLKLEEEISELSGQELKELGLIESALDRLIKICYDTLDLVTFYTVAGGQEVRAWTIKKNAPIVVGAGKIHQDFQEKFIKAEVINWQSLLNCGSWPQAREKGLIRTEGKDYLLQDGDVIEIKI